MKWECLVKWQRPLNSPAQVGSPQSSFSWASEIAVKAVGPAKKKQKTGVFFPLALDVAFCWRVYGKVVGVPGFSAQIACPFWNFLDTVIIGYLKFRSLFEALSSTCSTC